jgi:hypothetical protein
MDPMHDEDDVTLNAKAILLAVGGATVAGLLFVLARRDEKQDRAEAVVEDIKHESKKAAKEAKKKRGELAAAAAATVGFDAKAAERDLKAAAWDAQQEAREAESRLRAAGHRVVEDASHLASRFGSEARNLAGEGRERIAQFRHRDEPENAVEREIVRLRAEVEELRGQLGRPGKRPDRDIFGLTSRLTGKGSPASEAMVSQAAAAALAQLERSLKAKAPALLAAKNRAQVMEILQQELGPTLRESAVQAAAAALGLLETAREERTETRERVRDAAEQVRRAGIDAQEAARIAADDARIAAEQAAESVRSNGKHRFWRPHHEEPVAAISERAEELVEATAQKAESPSDGRRGHAGLLWGGAGLGLALYALLDAERRDQVLRLANEASVQFQELLRDLQGYDDEF